MKRILTGIALVITYVFLGIVFINVWGSDGRLMSNSVTLDENACVYFLQQGFADLWINKMDQNGQIVDMGRCAKVVREVQARCCYANEKIYILQIWYKDGTQHFAIYESNDEKIQFHKIWQQEIAEDLTITDFSIIDENFMISGIEQKTEHIICYSVINGEGSRIEYQTEALPVAAYWGNGGIYVTTSDNKAVFFAIDSMEETECIDDVIYFRATMPGFFYQKNNEDNLIFRQYDGLVTYTYENITNITGMDYSEADSTLVTLSLKNDNIIFTFFTSEEERHDVEITYMNDIMVLQRLFPAILLFTLVYIIVLIFSLIFYHWIMVKRRLLLQTFGILSIISVVWISLMFVCLYQIQQKQILEERAFFANTCIKLQKENLTNELTVKQLNYHYFEDKNNREIAENILADNTLKDTWQKIFARTDMLYGSDDVKIAFSEEQPYGTAAKTVYSSEIIDYVKKCNETEAEQSFVAMYRGIRYAFHIVPLGNLNNQLCLMIRIPVNGVESQEGTLYSLMIGIVAAWIVIVIVLLIFLRTRWQTITLLISQMDKISKGDYHIEEKRIPENEIGEIWTSMERMCKYLKMQNYKKNGVLDYIYQFAPQNFEKLFGKENLQDIEIGEMIQIPATIGIISIIDKENLLKGKVQRQYIQYVNQLMEILFQQEGAQDAVFMQSGSNLENVKVIFRGEKDSVDAGLKYGISCMETLLGQPEKRYDSNPFILFHSSKYLCGLAGGSKQAYPFVMSMELEILNNFISDFRENGIKMVVTEQTKQWMRSDINMRYIGYVASDDNAYKFDVYEILDCYSLNVKAAKMRTQQEFGEALELFYQNDYYLARSKFSEILKACQEDGIVRWYVFACEALFNKEDNINVRHDLFSNYD